MGAGGRRLDVAALDAALSALERSGLDRHALHARTLREVLELHRVHVAAGWEIVTTSQLAMARQVSEDVAAELLGQALLLSSLEAGLDSLACGVVTTEQAGVLARALLGLDAGVQAGVWVKVLGRLRAARVSGEVVSPARLAALVAGWVIEADPVEAEQRRQRAEQAAQVQYRRRQDGLVDLFALGISGVNGRAVLSRIRQRSQPWGAGDDRPVGRRRLDALVDLLLGRDQLPLDGETGGSCCPCRLTGVPRQAAACGCLPGSPAPCGVQVSVLVPIGAGLGTTDELAMLVGHGPLDRGQLLDVLASAPVLRSVWVDEHGTPVSEGRVERPGRGDLAGVRQALLRLQDATPPDRREPRHPLDHPPPPTAPPRRPRQRDVAEQNEQEAAAGRPRTRLRRRRRSEPPASAHPPDTPGPYRVGAGLRRLLEVRAPRCEWPACGAASSRCDVDHDVAWPIGATCGCNLGPLCRRHHRLKHLLLHGQPLMRKQRLPGNKVRWTDPTGRVFTCPSQHPPPADTLRPPPPLQAPVPGDCTLSDEDLAEQLWLLDHDGQDHDGQDRTADGLPWMPTTPDPLDQPRTDQDALGERLLLDQRWGYELDNPYLWLPTPAAG